ncbi:MAG: quinone-dependent dihydroorotate dehydrogenase [Caulobacterales bacterium]
MDIFQFIRPLLFTLEPERAHHLSLHALSLLPESGPLPVDPVLGVELAGLRFPSPVGLAAGYDKDCDGAHKLLRFGFGAVEIGTITPKPQPGNPKPRLFRLEEDWAVINRMGFNSGGQTPAVVERLRRARAKGGIIGVNIGANKDSEDRIADYIAGVKTMAPVASYLTMNISSPNTPGLRKLQDGSALADLLVGAKAALPPNGPPLFLKVAPDLEPAEVDSIAKATMGQVDALIVANTTISRPQLHSRFAAEQGGLSGAPLRDLAQQRLRDFRKATGGVMPLIGAGGIATAEDAYARIRAGACFVQLYSAMVYEGPWLAARINKGLKTLLARDGLKSIADALGADAR